MTWKHGVIDRLALVAVLVTLLVGCGRSDIYWRADEIGDGAVPFSCEFSDIADIHGTGSGNVRVVGEGGCVLHFDGVEWSEEPAPADKLNAVHVISDDVAFAVGANAVWKRSSGGWEQVFSMPGAEFVDVWADSENFVVAVGKDTDTNTGIIAIYDGNDWKHPASLVIPSVLSVWGEHPGSVWVGGEDVLLHFDGTQWLAEETGFEFEFAIRNLNGRGEGELWFHVSSDPDNGCIVRRAVDDEGTSVFQTFCCQAWGFPGCYEAVWTSEGNDILMPCASSMGHPPRFNGVEVFDPFNACIDHIFGVPEGAPDRLRAIWGVSADEFYVAGPAASGPVLWKLEFDPKMNWKKIY